MTVVGIVLLLVNRTFLFQEASRELTNQILFDASFDQYMLKYALANGSSRFQTPSQTLPEFPRKSLHELSSLP